MTTPKTPPQSSFGSPKSIDKTLKTSDTTFKKGTLTLSIPPLNVLVKKQYLLNLEEGFGEYVQGSIVSVESYPGHLPTFTVLLCDGVVTDGKVSDGSVFAYLPVFAVVQEAISCSTYEAEDHYRVFCPSDDFVYYEAAWLKNLQVCVFNTKKEQLPGWGSYLFSLEWPNENEQVHLIALNGQLYFVPNHKLLVRTEVVEFADMKLPSWRKLRQEWTKPSPTPPEDVMGFRVGDLVRSCRVSKELCRKEQAEHLPILGFLPDPQHENEWLVKLNEWSTPSRPEHLSRKPIEVGDLVRTKGSYPSVYRVETVDAEKRIFTTVFSVCNLNGFVTVASQDYETADNDKDSVLQGPK